jgi:anti-sigma-K factor RskA
MDEARFTELAALYAVGALDGAEQHEFEQYLQTASAAEKRELRELTEMSALMPLALPQPAVPARLKARLMERVKQEQTAEEVRAAPFKTPETTPPPQRFSFFDLFSWQPLLTAATLMLAITSGLLLWQNSNVSRERDQLAQQVAELSRLNVATQKQLDELVTQTTKFVSLAGKEAPQAKAKVFWDTQRNQWVVYVFDLPAPPTDKSYQLWFVTSDQQKFNAQVFETNANGRASFSIPVPQDVASRLAATAVTLEPKGGSPQPTNTNFYLLGQVGV